MFMGEPAVDYSLSVLFEDDSMIVVAKSGNMPVHEGGLYVQHCLTAILEKRLGYRVFPVFRLDRETSGIVVFAKNSSFVKGLFDSISSKEYVAVVRGVLRSDVVIDTPIGECAGDFIDWKKCVASSGKKSVTSVFVQRVVGGNTLVRVVPQTGRQHQIRVHLSSIGHPILFDKVYGSSDKLFKDYLTTGNVGVRQMLHLARIVIGGKEILCEMPEDMKTVIEERNNIV